MPILLPRSSRPVGAKLPAERCIREGVEVLFVGIAGDGEAGLISDQLIQRGALSGNLAPPPAWDPDSPAIYILRRSDASQAKQTWCGLHLAVTTDSRCDADAVTDSSAEQIDALWKRRLVPFETNLRSGRRAPRRQQADLGTDQRGADHPEEVVVDADPGRPVNINIRPVTAPIWRETLLFRDWLRSHDEERDAYAALKRGLAERSGRNVDDYNTDKMPWISAALARAGQWAARSNWSP
jgi:hypothetical protein